MPQAVQFPIYRQYEDSRKRANNAMVSLLAGSQLATHTLKLTAGSTLLLPEIFPAVPHIGRFNLRTDAAAEILDDAGPYLATVTVPYALAIHEDFVNQVITWISTLQGINEQRNAANHASAAEMHEVLLSLVGGNFLPRESVDLELFHLYRIMRNCHIHNGGRVSNALREQANTLSGTALARLKSLTERDPDTFATSDQADYHLLDVFAIFAVTKTLGRGINTLLQTGLSKAQWAEACVGDYCAISSKSPNSNPWGRALIGYARKRYEPLALTKDALFQAAARLGKWRDPQSYPD